MAHLLVAKVRLVLVIDAEEGQSPFGIAVPEVERECVARVHLIENILKGVNIVEISAFVFFARMVGSDDRAVGSEEVHRVLYGGNRKSGM